MASGADQTAGNGHIEQEGGGLLAFFLPASGKSGDVTDAADAPEW